jgi:ADP-heptose:LPS heptosyltransferase
MGDKCIFYPENEPLTFEYDEHIPIGSLCQYLRRNEINFESSRYGFLKDDELKTAEIKKDLVALTPSNHKICGISWRSVSQKTGIHKTIPLKYFIETLDLEGYTFVNLQYGDTKDEIQKVREELGVNIISYDEVDNFMDIDGLSSLIQACDTVITIDNVTCQLAGALGKETHILLSFDPWWGWMIDSNKSPWHPSLNLYRQEKINDWDGAFKKLKIAFF